MIPPFSASLLDRIRIFASTLQAYRRAEFVNIIVDVARESGHDQFILHEAEAEQVILSIVSNKEGL